MRLAETGQRSPGLRYYQLLLGCLPGSFLARHGDELATVFEDMRAELEERPGPLTLVRFYGGLTVDVARRMWPEWKRATRGRSTVQAASRGRRLLRDLSADLRFALRSLRKRPLFAAVAVLSLAIGIGANTALFTTIHAAWLEPIAGVVGADRVVEPLVVQRGREYDAWAYPDFEDVREAGTPIELLAGCKGRDASLGHGHGAEKVRALYVSADYFQVLGVMPALGRDFLPAEDGGTGEHPVTILSHVLWQTRFGGDPDIVGRAITLNRTTHTVVGVAPENFRGHRRFRDGPDVWVPLVQHPFVAGERSFKTDRRALWLEVLGRLRADATVAEADAALQVVFARLRGDFPESNKDRGGRVMPFGPIPAVGRAQSTLGMTATIALAGLVLLIICGNVAGMALARGASREREIAVRMALGSGRGRLVRLLGMEALVLALAGGGLGVLVAFLGVGSPWFESVAGPPGAEFRPNGLVLAFSLALTAATTLAVGLLPALRFSRPELTSSLKSDAGTGLRRVGRVHRLAASAQTGIALLFLVICTLFLRALGVIERRELGFEPHGLLLTRMDLFQEGYASQQEAEVFLERVREAVGSLPGVTSVSIADGIPLDLVGNFTSVGPADHGDSGSEQITVEFTRASEGFFSTIGTPILRGRGFQSTDDPASDPVVIITKGLAEAMWPGEEPLGRRLRFRVSAEVEQDFTVVGVVPDLASSRATEDHPQVFVCLRQTYRPRVLVVARGAVVPVTLARSVQSAILDVDPGLALPEVVTSEFLVAQSRQGHQVGAGMAGGLGILALLLAAIGIYAVVAIAVASRTREIGLRMALGATRQRVLTAVLRDALRLAVPGLGGGALLAVGIAAIMRSELVGVSPLAPIALGCAVAVLLAVVMLASLVPARRASAVHPMAALRWE